MRSAGTDTIAQHPLQEDAVPDCATVQQVEHVEDLVTKGTPGSGHLEAHRRDEGTVLRQAQCTVVQLLGHGVSRHPSLQLHLAAHGDAPGDERRPVGYLSTVALEQLLGDHELSVEDRADDAGGHQRAAAGEQLARGRHVLLPPCRIDQVQLLAELTDELPLAGEEELELQEVTYPQRTLPAALTRIPLRTVTVDRE